MMRAATERGRPPAPPTTTRSPTSAAFELPSGSAGEVEASQGLQQAEAGLLIVAQHVTRHRRARRCWLIQTVSRLGDEVPDGRRSGRRRG